MRSPLPVLTATTSALNPLISRHTWWENIPQRTTIKRASIKERVHLYLVETKKFGATGHLDNGFRRLLSHWPRTRFQPRLYPAFLQYFERGQITSGESGMAVPRNLVHLWSAKFCSFHTRLVHSGCSRNLTSSGLSSWMCAKCSTLIFCFCEV